MNATGSPVRELSRTAPTPGDELPLTIDNRLQEFAIGALGQESGAVVTMDVTAVISPPRLHARL